MASPFTSAEPSQFSEGETPRGGPVLLQVAETPEKAWQLAESIAFSEEVADPGGCPVLSGLSAVSHLPPDGSEASRGVRKIQDAKYTQTRHRLEVFGDSFYNPGVDLKEHLYVDDLHNGVPSMDHLPSAYVFSGHI
ncbi:Focal Adhesion Kinase 1 [Manis pentadactyla]|nr:Focal Adhesion Kinase 1 [Manis pentadactyla]